MSVRGNVPAGEFHSGNCPSGKCPFGELPVEELSFGQLSVKELSVGEISSGNCPSGKSPSGKCPSGNCPRAKQGSSSTTSKIFYSWIEIQVLLCEPACRCKFHALAVCQHPIFIALCQSAGFP